ncbi:VMA21-like domain protein [Teladorsagia circumcincta]|uniref:VMA21-like domain protein n=1 Tax=Teladorsagia circumcincta TaxID=45464 RepID=A0A2G9UZ13_TELCI|nr:VMA21-like domain protein [Teladorsagia circumcincta]
MSDEYDVVQGDSSSNTSTTGSFENVNASAVADSCDAAKVTNDDATDEKSTDAEQENVEATPEWAKSDDELLYTSAHTRSAITNLIRFSAAMFVLPLLTMFTTYHYVFRDYFDLPPDQAMLYAGLCGVAVVILIMIAFVYIAYREEQADEKKLSLRKSE